MEVWIGPVILAAVIAGLVNVAGWFVTFGNTRRLERDRRLEKVIDIQAALLAEIRSDYANLSRLDPGPTLVEIANRIEQSGEGYVPFVPRDAGIPIFDAVVGDISILPTDVIDPVVIYYKQREAIGHFAEDLRSSRFADLSPDLKVEMLGDYLDLRQHARTLAENAMHALQRSLKLPQGVNKRVSAPSDRKSA